jgi:hypothetical protein
MKTAQHRILSLLFAVSLTLTASCASVQQARGAQRIGFGIASIGGVATAAHVSNYQHLGGEIDRQDTIGMSLSVSALTAGIIMLTAASISKAKLGSCTRAAQFGDEYGCRFE